MNTIENKMHSGSKAISKELRSKANDFLNSRRHAENLVDILNHLRQSVQSKQPINSALLTLEVIFTELLKRREMSIEVSPTNPKDDISETKYREWLFERYEEALNLILSCIEIAEKPNEASQSLVTSMKLLSVESKYPIDKTESTFKTARLCNILQKLLIPHKSQFAVIQRFKEYAEFWDVVYHSWKLLPTLSSKAEFQNEVFACNLLELINALPVTKEINEAQKCLCYLRPKTLEYSVAQKHVNKLWLAMMQWCDGMNEAVHKQVLIVLLERFLHHLDKPILLTDFLMDSLDCGGVVSLLALQGVFTLIQKHNITYPNVYEKLYSMFEPEIFHTKFKARLFYLADIFLSSTHLPESLVAAFVKRLARLSLLAPPQDAIIILYFIGNLILRHSGLKRLICAQAALEVSSDPFIMEEREPMKSKAIESSLWEIVALQKHALPTVASAARFISQPLPVTEWDLSTVLEIKDDDVFDQEIAKKTKQYALAFERPQKLFLGRNDKLVQYWKLF